MIIYSDFKIVSKLNYLQVKGGLSPYYNPLTIVEQHHLDYNIQFTITFGSFVQANNNNNMTNLMFLQTVDDIYLRSLEKIQGKHEIFDIHSHRFIMRRKIIKVPIIREL